MWSYIDIVYSIQCISCIIHNTVSPYSPVTILFHHFIPFHSLLLLLSYAVKRFDGLAVNSIQPFRMPSHFISYSTPNYPKHTETHTLQPSHTTIFSNNEYSDGVDIIYWILCRRRQRRRCCNRNPYNDTTNVHIWESVIDFICTLIDNSHKLDPILQVYRIYDNT